MDDPNIPINNQLVLISGESATGKSASLMNIPDQPRWLYMNCEAGKRLPFRNKFQSAVITDPYEIYEGFVHASSSDDVSGVIIDTLTFLMEMQESVHILGTADTQAAWREYAEYFKRLMQQYVAGLGKPVIILAHTKSAFNEKAQRYDVVVPVKGSLKNNGLEAYFSTVVSTKKVPIKDLVGQDPNLLHITDEDEALGYKHVFQTRLTKDTVGERIRSPMGMFKANQTYIDNDAFLLLRHLHEYYGD